MTGRDACPTGFSGSSRVFGARLRAVIRGKRRLRSGRPDRAASVVKNQNICRIHRVAPCQREIVDAQAKPRASTDRRDACPTNVDMRARLAYLQVTVSPPPEAEASPSFSSIRSNTVVAGPARRGQSASPLPQPFDFAQGRLRGRGTDGADPSLLFSP